MKRISRGQTRIFLASILLLQLVFAGSLRAEARQENIYSGVPMGEALVDLLKNHCVPIATPLNYTKELDRADSFRLKDGKVLYVEMKADKQGGSYTVVRMATFDLKDMSSVTVKKLAFFKSFDLGKSVGWNP